MDQSNEGSMKKFLAVTAVLLIALLVAASAQAASGGRTQYNSKVCGHDYVPLNDGVGDYFNVYNAPDGKTCVTVQKYHNDWYVSSDSGTALWGYPNISSGIEWGKYTCYDGKSAYVSSPGSKCMRYPVVEHNDGTPVTSIQQVWSHLQEGDVSYDIWFNKTNVKPQNLGQPNGAEIMIWLQHPNVALKNFLWTTTIQGHKYNVIGWTAAHNGKTWYYTAYVAAHPMKSFPKTYLNKFFRNAIAHGRLSSKWYLTAINFGEEVAKGGDGFDVHNYQLSGVK